jgi:hypothetical protein
MDLYSTYIIIANLWLIAAVTTESSPCLLCAFGNGLLAIANA